KHPTVRRAALRAGVPSAKVLARRQARNRLEPIGAAARKAGSMVVVYGPVAADALGLVEAPKRKRRAPTFLAAATAASRAGPAVRPAGGRGCHTRAWAGGAAHGRVARRPPPTLDSCPTRRRSWPARILTCTTCGGQHVGVATRRPGRLSRQAGVGAICR